MTPERWDRVTEILDRALSLAGDERANYLKSACCDDTEVRQEVESLLISHARAGTGFLNVTGAAAAPVLVFSKPKRLGKRIGPYLVEEQIGQGGMGEVYAATRVDGQYSKRVALKLVRAEFGSAAILERFRNERQILATLVHPNIAQLLDGGTAEDGVPYLVMELVEGSPVDSYCADHHLNVAQRLELFRSVCAAVQYAHQHLVVHRDIKPSNIVVTEGGTPKLLDFGIAKILGDSGSIEMTALRPMTPEYASPEQIQGRPVTTASDVYSLGVVLYRLLTDASPYALKTAGLGEISRAITEMEPTKPSDAVQRELNENPIEGNKDRLIRRLRGDLDAILLKALRKEPQLRYGSVEQLSEDIHRHLAGLPVHARKGTQSYRAWKFVRRHRVGVLASALSAGAIVAGGGVALHEARVAEMNRQRADRRFNDVRKLANSLIFEIHDSIRQLPGATGARKLLIDRAQGYLDSLANESQSDLSLQRELAGAYGRLAGVQGDSLDANLGNSAQALSNYRKATELLSKCLAMDPKNVEVQKELGSSYVDLSMALLRTGDKNGSKEYINKAVQFLETASSQYPNDRQLKATLGRAYERSGTVLAEVNDLNGALSQYQKSLTVLLMASDGSPVSQSAIGFAHKHIGSVLAVQNKLDDALHHYKEALAIDEALLARDPLNGQAKYAVTFSYSDTGWILDKMGDSRAALQYYAKAMRIRQALAEADPQDVRARRGLGNTYNYIGNIHRERKEYAESLDSLRKALAIREALVVKDPSNQGYPFDVAETQANLGFTYLAQASVAASAQRAKLRQSAALYMGKALPVYEERKKQGRLKGTEVATVADLERELGKLAASQNLK